MTASKRARSAASLIHDGLRAEIVSLRRRPGETIVEAEIAAAYGVSRTPAREAILRLAAEGLIDIFPQSGTFVAPIPVDELPETIELRRVLEAAVVRRAALVADAGSVALLERELACQRAAEDAGDQEAFHASDERFHATLASIAGRRRFWEAILRAKTQVDRFRRLTLPGAGRMGAVVAEHALVASALARGDADAAAAAMDAHLAALLAAIDAARAADPAMFSGGRPGRDRG